MLDTLLAKVVGTQNERELKRLRPIVGHINALEPAIQALSDDQLRTKTAELKERTAKGESLDKLLVEAFAVVREAGRRVLNMALRSSSGCREWPSPRRSCRELLRNHRDRIHPTSGCSAFTCSPSTTMRMRSACSRPCWN